MATERIIITFKKNGTLRGISAQGFDGLPVPVAVADLITLAPTINTAALAKAADNEALEAIIAQKNERIDRLISRAEKALTGDVADLQIEVDESKLTAKQKRLAEIDAEEAKLAEEKARLLAEAIAAQK